MKSSLAFLRKHVLPVLVCFVAAWWLGTFEWVQRVENVTLDARTRLRAQVLSPTLPRDEFALIGIDEQSLKDLGRWPWNREIHGDLLQVLGRVRPSVVAWDILFTEPAPEDEYMAKAVLLGGANVVLGANRADGDIGVKPDDPELKKSGLIRLPDVQGDLRAVLTGEAAEIARGTLGVVCKAGFVDTPPGPDGVRREAPLIVRIGDGIYPTLSLMSLMQYWHLKPEEVHVRLGDAIILENSFARRRIPIDASGAYLINYRHALDGYITYGYSEVRSDLIRRFAKKESTTIPALTGRILLVGQTADGLSDFGPTPFSPLTPLVLVHANVIENVLNADFPRRAPDAPILLGGVLLGVVSLAFFARRKFREQALFAGGVPVVYALVAVLCWTHFSLWLPVVWPILGFVSGEVFDLSRRLRAEQRQKEQIKGMFGTYLAPAVVSRIIDSGEMPRLGGYQEEITPYFSDIQSFSSFSELLEPEALVELMNEYLTACTDIVQDEGGTLDKYIGDAVVAMFGAPLALREHGYKACIAALRVQRQMAELRAKWSAEGTKWPAIVRNMRTRIGLNTGRCVVGNMGSRTRFNYTMMGDDVNLAARMESGAKQWGTYTMCTEATKLACEKHGGDRVVFRPLGKIVVKGRSHPVPIFELAALKEDATSALRECVGLFTEGLERCYARDWPGALAKFAASAELEPNQPQRTPGVSVNPSLVYIEITKQLQAAPPSESWGGVYVMQQK